MTAMKLLGDRAGTAWSRDGRERMEICFAYRQGRTAGESLLPQLPNCKEHEVRLPLTAIGENDCTESCQLTASATCYMHLTVEKLLARTELVVSCYTMCSR